jgi:hypothetical protein
MNYDPCCARDGCTLPNKMVTFAHKCVMCQEHLHVICGVVDAICCNQCILKYASPATPVQDQKAALMKLSPMALCAIGVLATESQKTVASINAFFAAAIQTMP